ncbi:MAG TPA: helix-turn-helix transcriptional regulator [Solirubrobacteraceae bacterium]
MSAHDEEIAAELISRIRAVSGFSQTELARRSGLDRSVVSAYEHGRRQPSVAALARIAAAAGMELDLAPASNAAAEEHAGRVLGQVLELAEALPYKPRDELTYPPLIELRA